MDADLKFYGASGPMSAPGRQARRLEGLPRDVAGLVEVVQGVLLHLYWAERYGVQPSKERSAETEIRPVEERLETILSLDPRPLTSARPPERRSLSTCRDFTLLTVSLLRHQGVPARARSGFARYFQPDWYMDHWIVEWWNPEQKRWIGVDAQLDRLQRDVLKLPFDPLDVPADQFVNGGVAYKQWRAGKLDPSRCGIGELHGVEFVRGNLMLDFSALNKVEMLPWDVWPIMQTGTDAQLDQVAACTGGRTVDGTGARLLYGRPEFRVPTTITSHTRDGDREVRLPASLVRESA